MYRSLSPVFAAVLLALGAWPAAAQSTSCDIVSAEAVSLAVGWTVTLDDTPSSSVTSCFFSDDTPGIGHVVTVSLKRGAFDAGGAANPAALASQMISIPAEYHDEIGALHEVGVPVQMPEYSVSLASGAGDGAVWIAQRRPWARLLPRRIGSPGWDGRLFIRCRRRPRSAHACNVGRRGRPRNRSAGHLGSGHRAGEDDRAR